MAKYDCILTVSHLPTKNACLKMELEKLDRVFTSYYIRLNGGETACLVRKANKKPPTPSMSYMRRTIFENPDYMHNILDYIVEVNKHQLADEPVPDHVDGKYVYSFESLDLGKRTPRDFIDSYEVSVALGKIAGDL